MAYVADSNECRHRELQFHQRDKLATVSVEWGQWHQMLFFYCCFWQCAVDGTREMGHWRSKVIFCEWMLPTIWFLAEYLQYNFGSEKQKTKKHYLHTFTLSISHTFFILCRIWNLKLFKTQDPAAILTNIATNEDILEIIMLLFFF